MQLEEKQKLFKPWIEAYIPKRLHWAGTKSNADEIAKVLVEDTFMLTINSNMC
jgi:hypothetical protein